jgi:hypothetical protein
VRWQQKRVRQATPESQRASDVSLSGAWETNGFLFFIFFKQKTKKKKMK